MREPWMVRVFQGSLVVGGAAVGGIAGGGYPPAYPNNANSLIAKGFRRGVYQMIWETKDLGVDVYQMGFGKQKTYSLMYTAVYTF